ncbi:MAG: hypothetical protein IJ087_10355 [Eggerthellaceae bacterium]|nr:hypothetical protein [Eggerthellaceae bacterium]
MKINVDSIITTFLRKGGYGGLYNEVGKCGCRLGELTPCVGPINLCEPAYELTCPCCGESVFVPASLCQNTDEKDTVTLTTIF